MGRTVLITGATGTVSSALIEALADSDFELRALVRDPGKAGPLRERGAQVSIGDLDDARSLPEAFDGVEDLWLLPPNGPRSSENSMNAVWAARQAGVRRVVRLSAVGAAYDAPTRSGRLHALSDHELRASEMNWTILRPQWFMQNLLNAAGDIAVHLLGVMARRSYCAAQAFPFTKSFPAGSARSGCGGRRSGRRCPTHSSRKARQPGACPHEINATHLLAKGTA
jgi:uncharacterized protein YbjT (DUF2867 family)